MFPVKMNLAKDAGGWVYRTVERAKAKLGIESVKHDFDGSWYWAFPEQIGPKAANTAITVVEQ